MKYTLVQALRLCIGRTAHRGSRGITLLFLDYGNRRGWVVSVTPRPLFTPEKTRYPLCRKLGGLRAGMDRCGKSRPPLGFDPRTVQPVAIRYTDWAIPAHLPEVTFTYLNTGTKLPLQWNIKLYEFRFKYYIMRAFSVFIYNRYSE